MGVAERDRLTDEIAVDPSRSVGQFRLMIGQDSSVSELVMNHTDLTPRPEAVESIPRLLRLPAVMEVTGLARSTVYRMIAEHTFPAPVKLAKRAVGWRHDDVRQWTIGRPGTSR